MRPPRWFVAELAVGFGALGLIVAYAVHDQLVRQARNDGYGMGYEAARGVFADA